MQVQNNKEEVPFAHYEEKFRALDPIESAKRCGVPFADGKFSVRLLGVTYQITWPDYAITADRDGAFGLSSLPCQTFLLRFLLERGDLAAVCALVGNVFEQVIDPESDIFTIRRRLTELGADAACMSGSGSAVFGLFTKEETARAAQELLSQDYPRTFLAKTV